MSGAAKRSSGRMNTPISFVGRSESEIQVGRIGHEWLETGRSTASTLWWVEVWVAKFKKPRTLTWRAFARSGWSRLPCIQRFRLCG